MGQQSRGDDEEHAIHDHADDKRPSSACIVDGHDAAPLSEESNDRVVGLIFQRIVSSDSDQTKDFDRIVLDRRYSSHLNGRLDGHSEEESSETGLVGEELLVGFRFVLVFESDRILNLRVFRNNSWIMLVPMRMQLGKDSEAFVGFAVIDEPTRGFGEQKDEHGEDASRNDLDTQRYAPLLGRACREPNVGTV